MKVHLVDSENQYWALVKELSGPQSVFDAQGDAHGRIDDTLQEAIEGVLIPLSGPCEGSEIWFHTQDFFGDGIRSLIYRVDSFPNDAVVRLQPLLVDEAAAFCISVQLCDKLFGSNILTVGGIAILQADVVATKSVCHLVQTYTGV